MLKEENNLGMVITLLKEKNSYLETFLEVSERERKSFKARNFDNLEALYAIREDILENIRSLDRRIEKYSRDLQPESLQAEERETIRKLLSQKQSLVNGIMAQDLPIPQWVPRVVLPLGYALLIWRLGEVLWNLLRGGHASLLGDEVADAMKLLGDDDSKGDAA